MAQRKGQVVVSTLVTPDSGSNFPIVDSNDIGGGRHIVATIAERNNILSKLRKTSMIAHVLADKTDYQLLPGFPQSGPLSDSNWKVYAPGVPANVITEHQKVEDIKFADTTEFTKLTDKLNDMDSKLDNAITTHNTVEQIKYGDSVASGFEFLTQKLASMDQNISDASIVPSIEEISWGTTPSDSHTHVASLSGEIENLYSSMNDPNKIIVTEMDYTTKMTLQQKLDQLTTHVPNVEEIKNESGVALMSIITDAGDIDYITYDVKDEPTLTLRQKLNAMDGNISSALDGLNNIHIEDVAWEAVPNDIHNHKMNLSDELESLYSSTTLLQSTVNDMNDPTKIMIGTDTLVTTINNLRSDVDAAASEAAVVPTIEDISWGTTPEGHQSNLSSELNSISFSLSDINDELEKFDDMNDPTKIMIGTDTLVTTINNLRSDISDAASEAAVVPTIEEISWGTTPSDSHTHVASLSGEIENLYNTMDNMNDPTKIMIGTDTLVTTINNLKTGISDAASEAAVVPTIEEISWETIPSDSHTHVASLSGEIENLYATMNDPTKIMIGTDTLVTTINNLKSGVSDAASEAAVVPTIEKISWGTTPEGHQTSLTNEINALYNKTNNISSEITLINTSITTLTSSINSANSEITLIKAALPYPPQILLFSFDDLSTGEKVEQEYLTNYTRSKIDEVTIYTDGGSTLAGDTSIIIETSTDGSTYTGIGSNRLFTLASTDTAKLKKINTSSDNYILADSTRIRINISAVNANNVINSLMVRVKLSNYTSS